MDKKIIWVLLAVVVVAIIIMQGKKEGMSPYICHNSAGESKAGYDYEPQYIPTSPGPYGILWVTDYYGDEIHRKTDYCLDSDSVRQYWCDLGCYEKQCWATDSETFFSVDFDCNGGCSNGICTVVYNYANFLSYKDSYLSGGDFVDFISNANKWVV